MANNVKIVFANVDSIQVYVLLLDVESSIVYTDIDRI